jgi:uncharacterized protein
MRSFVLWRDARSGAVEVCVLATTESRSVLQGTVLRPFDGRPAIVRYRVETDPVWRTMEVWTEVETAEGTGELELSADGEGHWSSSGSNLPDLDGCIDVDLGVSPSTNTLPIRRLELDEGETQDVRAAWVRYPELTVEVLAQSYERITRDRYRYRSDTFAAELLVDGNGLVLDYEGVWKAKAVSAD